MHVVDVLLPSFCFIRIFAVILRIIADVIVHVDVVVIYVPIVAVVFTATSTEGKKVI